MKLKVGRQPRRQMKRNNTMTWLLVNRHLVMNGGTLARETLEALCHRHRHGWDCKQPPSAVIAYWLKLELLVPA